MRFGWFDVIDDVEVTKALLDKVIAFGKEHNLENIEGPIGFSNLDKVGCLIEGFKERGLMITWYNFPYYATHFEQLGFVKEKVYLESKFPFSNIDATNFQRVADMIEKRYDLTHLNFTKPKTSCHMWTKCLRYSTEVMPLCNPLCLLTTYKLNILKRNTFRLSIQNL